MLCHIEPGRSNNLKLGLQSSTILLKYMSIQIHGYLQVLLPSV